jgi:hypothetical protein
LCLGIFFFLDCDTTRFLAILSNNNNNNNNNNEHISIKNFTVQGLQESGVIAPQILTPALNGSELLDLLPVRFTLGEKALDIHRTAGWVDPRNSLHNVRKRKTLTLLRINPNFPVLQPVFQ